MSIFRFKLPVFVALLCLLAFSPDAAASLSSDGVLNTVLDRFLDVVANWDAEIRRHAHWIFWVLVVINMVWHFGQMALQQADLHAFFREFIKFTVTTGFFWWLLLNGPAMAIAMYDSMRGIAAAAAGVPQGLNPSGIVDIGFEIHRAVIEAISVRKPIASIVLALVGFAILIVLALVAINMLLLLITAYIFAYTGFFFLAFGGSAWTRDMAVNFMKTALGIAVQLMAMVILIGIGQTFLLDFKNSMSADITYGELGIMLVIAITLLILVNKVPSLLAGVITGASVGNTGVGNFGAGMAVGAGAAAATMGSMAIAAAKAGAANTGGAASAIKSAFQEAQQHMQTGTGLFAGASSAMASSGGGGVSSGGSQDFKGSGGGQSSFAAAMSSGLSALKTGATFAADMGANLGRGIGATASEGIAKKVDQAKDAMSSSAMGKVSSEIQNPGEAKQARLDSKDIGCAEQKQAESERKEKAAEARAFLSGNEGGGSISGGANSATENDSGSVNNEPSTDAGSSASSSAGDEMAQPASSDSGNAAQQQPLNDEVADFVNKNNGDQKND